MIALCALTPWCSPLIPLVAWAVYTLVYTLYRPTCRLVQQTVLMIMIHCDNREFQRAKLLALSPLCGNLSEAESGAVVIRALGAQKYYRQQNIHLTTNLLKTQFMQIGYVQPSVDDDNSDACRSNNWATTRLQLLAFPFTILNSVVPVYLRLLGLSAGAGLLQQFFHESKGSQMAGFVGLAISFALALPTAIGSVVWSISLLEQKMCSVQRVREIVTEIGPTVDNDLMEQVLVNDIRNLPERTGLQLKNVGVSYQKLKNQSLALDSLAIEQTRRFSRENLPPSLSGVTVEALPGEHVGVIGRTGAGQLI